MEESEVPENPYLLLTPGPLSTTSTVREAMLRDWCTWDTDYNTIVQSIRRRLVTLADDSGDYTTVLMQGSGTFSVESVIGTAVSDSDKLLVIANGAYGSRMAEIASYLAIDLRTLDFGEKGPIDLVQVQQVLERDSAITHVAVVHCETTTGRLNDVEALGKLVKSHDKTYIVDAMSSFGGVSMSMSAIGADFLVSSANKCIQGVPGFGFVISRRESLEATAGQGRSLSLDMYAQWRAMEDGNGKWRFTSPTHVVRAFYQALQELDAEGGIEARSARYKENQRLLVAGMEQMGFQTLLPLEEQSPIITSFISPESEAFSFAEFYEALKQRGFVIYPGKVTDVDTFRIGNIGDVFSQDIERLLVAVAESQAWDQDRLVTEASGEV